MLLTLCVAPLAPFSTSLPLCAPGKAGGASSKSTPCILDCWSGASLFEKTKTTAVDVSAPLRDVVGQAGGDMLKVLVVVVC